MRSEELEHELLGGFGRRSRRVLPLHRRGGADAAVSVERPGIRVGEAGRRRLLERRPHRLQIGGQPEVVAVDEADEAAAGLGDAVVTGSRGALVLLPDEADARVLCLQRLDDRRRVVARAVVDDDELEVAPRLREDGADRRSDRATGVVGRHHCRERWLCHSDELTSES